MSFGIGCTDSGDELPVSLVRRDNGPTADPTQILLAGTRLTLTEADRLARLLRTAIALAT